MRIDLSGHKFIFPQQCACCSAAPQTTLSASSTRTSGKRVVHTDTKSWDFPYCYRCIAHIRAVSTATTIFYVIAVVSFFAAAYVGLTANLGLGFLTAIAGIGGAVALFQNSMARAKAICASSCASVKTAIAYHGWRGACHTFEISSAAYALAFMQANQGKLVNVRPETWQWMQANGFMPTQGTQAQSAKRYMT